MRSSTSRRAAVAALALMSATLLVVTVADLPGAPPGRGFRPFVDGWVQGTFFVAAAVLCLLGAARRQQADRCWTWIALALVARAVGFVLYLGVVRWVDPIPYPSVSDAAWLLSQLFTMVGLVLLVRSRARWMSTGLTLDGITGALAASALAMLLLYDTLVARVTAAAPASVVFTNLAYPVTDVMLALVLVGVVMAFRWRPPASVVALALGVVGYAVVDAVFLVQVTAGTFGPGTLLTPLAMAANAGIALAPWLPGRSDRERREALPGVALPAVFAGVCLAVLVDAALRPAPRLVVGLAGLGVAVVIARTALSFQTVRRAARDRRDARTDDLTGLANRRAFTEELVGSLHARDPRDPLAVLVANLDGFKRVNDELGHHNGDELLRQVAARFQDGLGTEDLLARIGADEFGMVLAGADRVRAGEVAERLQATLRRPFPVGGRDLDVTASLGITGFPHDGDEPGVLLQHADLAMYETKVNRSEDAVHRPQPHQADLSRQQTVARLRRAILEEEIVLHYQSVVRLDSGRVRGVEALCRWQHPERGLVPPAEFLPTAEGGGLMPLLTPHVLRTALRQAASWRAEGHNPSVAVNLSVTNLLDPVFPDQVAGLLETSGLPGASLQLELTEDLFLADPARARRAISHLSRYGVRLVVDDYGTGYSSLGYLRDLHEITGLKLDKSFVLGVVDNVRTAAIVESTLTLARSLGLTVVAEGIETVEIWERLVELGCELGQGYLFARPVPAHEQRFGVVAPAGPR